MERSVDSLLSLYRPENPLEKASTIPSPWYFDPRIARLENERVFAHTWQVAGRVDQVREKGQYFTVELGDEPIVVVRGEDGVLRAFYNVCRHHAAAVVTEVRGLKDFLANVPDLVAPLRLTEKLKFLDRRVYTLNCNWKVYVDNYLDGGYHVPHAHKGLSSVIEYTSYTIENFDRACLQSSPLSSDSGSEASVANTRLGRAFYLWLYPNFMINAYEGVMDTNLVLPLAVDKCAVVFDYYFGDTSAAAEERNRQSIRVSEVVQDEDMAICDAVQKGLASRAYLAGRLSVRREAGEHLFHRLLHADLTRGTYQTENAAAD